MNDVQALFDRDREAIEGLVLQHLRDVDINEASMTGTGASFQAGAGEAYATPKAFKKKNKED